MAIIQCPECGGRISDSAKQCPHCGYKKPKERNGCVIWILVVAVLLVVFCVFMKTKMDREREEMVKEVFYSQNEEGVSLSDISEAFQEAADKITDK